MPNIKRSLILGEWRVVEHPYPDSALYIPWYSRQHKHGMSWIGVNRDTAQYRWQCNDCGTYVPHEVTEFIKLLEWKQ